MEEHELQSFKFDGQSSFNLKKHPTKIEDIYEDKDEYEELLKTNQKRLDELQSIMYAHNRYGMVVIFQAMDAAGKDGTQKAVFSGVNPQGLRFYSFKRPTETELNHDYLWRTTLQLPERGFITIFNRSYYEEVLVVKVHPEILENSQKLPNELTQDMSQLWKNRYLDIQNFEKYLYNNGIRVVKFFLNISKKEQAERLIERIEDPTKNWKFQEQDVKEREFWNDYQQAYEDMINNTSTTNAPWYIVPADDKKNMRLIVGSILIQELEQLKMNYPEPDENRQAELRNLIDIINSQN